MSLPTSMMQPVVVLLAWSMVVWLWVLVTRIPTMQAMKIRLDPTLPPAELTRPLPAKVRWKADNYNHLMEQPTLFYAAALTLALADPGNRIALAAAWAYVGLRIAHSLVQTLINHIPTRFSLFVFSSLALVLMIHQAAMAVFGWR